jgi:hypothetical protein
MGTPKHVMNMHICCVEQPSSGTPWVCSDPYLLSADSVLFLMLSVNTQVQTPMLPFRELQQFEIVSLNPWMLRQDPESTPAFF